MESGLPNVDATASGLLPAGAFRAVPDRAARRAGRATARGGKSSRHLVRRVLRGRRHPTEQCMSECTIARP